MATNPKEYWATYERTSPHISGAHKAKRVMITADWTLLDAAAAELEFESASGMVAELTRLIATKEPRKFAALVKKIGTGNFARAPKKTLRVVSSQHWDKPEVRERVRAAIFELSAAPQA